MYRVGTVARILKVVKLSGNNVNLIIQGLKRVRVDRFTNTEPFMKAAVASLDEVVDIDIELEALVRGLVNKFQKLVEVSNNISSDLGEMVLSAGSGEPGRLSDLAASVLNISAEEKIGLLERNNVKDRTQKLIEIVTREIELQDISTQIQSQVASGSPGGPMALFASTGSSGPCSVPATDSAAKPCVRSCRIVKERSGPPPLRV